MDANTAADPTYGYTAHLSGVSFDEPRARTVAALKQEGFGVLTEIDVKSTLKSKRNWLAGQFIAAWRAPGTLSVEAIEGGRRARRGDRGRVGERSGRCC